MCSSCPGTRGFPAPVSGESPVPAPLPPKQESALSLLLSEEELGASLSAFSPYKPSGPMGHCGRDPKKRQFSEKGILETCYSHFFSLQINSWDHFCRHLSSFRSLSLHLAHVFPSRRYAHRVITRRKILFLHQEDLGQALELCCTMNMCH